MEKRSHQIHDFDKFTLDLTRGCLLHGHREIKLRPKPFEALKYLVENPGRLISKAELIQTIWPDTAVTDDSLVQCLMEVRRALGDEGQQIIRTVPRRGYIFDKEVVDNGAKSQITTYTEETASVQVIIEEETNGQEASEIATRIVAMPAAPKGSRVSRFANAIRRHKTATAVASVALAVVAVAGVIFTKPLLTWWFKPPSIAVLPFINATTTPDNDYLSDGFTESVIMSLTQINAPDKFPRLLVTAQTTVFTFKGRNVNPQTAGRELGVDQVLAGRIDEENGTGVIHVELINVENGSSLWRKNYFMHLNRPDELLAKQAEIAIDVAEKLPLRLTDQERQRVAKRYTQSPEAFVAFLRGRDAMVKGTPSGLRTSIEYYQQAIDLDPNFAVAYWAKGVAIAVQGNYGIRRNKEASDEAGGLYRKALMLDDSLYPAKAGIELQRIAEWDWAGIEKDGKKNVAYSFADGGYLVAVGRLDEVLERLKQFLAWAPTNPVTTNNAGHILFLMRRDDEAAAFYKTTQGLNPEFGPAYTGLGRVYLRQSRYDEAIAELQKADELGEHLPLTRAVLGYAYVVSGQRANALKILGELNERAAAGEYVTPLAIAWIHIALGDKDQAFTWLDKACDEHSGGLSYLKTEPIYDSLRSDPRFTDLLRRVHLPT